MKSPTEEEQDQQLKELLKPYCDEKDVSKTPIGWLIKPRKNLPPTMLVVMTKKLEALGAAFSATAGTFLLKEMSSGQRKEHEKYVDISLNDLVLGPTPRLNVDDISIEPLFLDLKVNGQKEHIIVRPSPKIEGKYENIDGNRRKRAAEALGWPTLKAEIRDLTDQEAFELAFILFNRKELSQFETGRYFKKAMELYPETYPTQKAVAKRFGKSESSISELISYYEEEQARIDSLKQDQDSPAEAPEKPNAADLTQKTTAQPDQAPENPDLGQKTEEKFGRPNFSGSQVADDTKKLPIPSPTHAAIIRRAPAELQPELRRMAATGKSTRDLETYITAAQQPPASAKDCLATAGKEYAREAKIEEAKKQALINSLKMVFPERLLQKLIEHFNPVSFGGMTNMKLATLAAKLISLEGADLKGFLAACDRLHETAEQNGQLEAYLRTIEENL